MLERLARPWSRLWDGTARLMDAIYRGAETREWVGVEGF